MKLCRNVSMILILLGNVLMSFPWSIRFHGILETGTSTAEKFPCIMGRNKAKRYEKSFGPKFDSIRRFEGIDGMDK